jgi:molybdopterin-containing oxidoreductase family membrane subunit
MFTGTIGLFLALFFLFIRFLPAIAIFEMRTIVPEAKLHPAHGPRGGGAALEAGPHG